MISKHLHLLVVLLESLNQLESSINTEHLEHSNSKRHPNDDENTGLGLRENSVVATYNKNIDQL